MAPACLYVLPTTSSHAPDESADSVLRDFVQELDQGITKLLDCLWLYLAASDTRYIMSHRFLIGFSQGNVRASHAFGINAFVIQKCPTQPGHMRPGIVLHQEKPRAHCNNVRSDNRSKDFMPVPNSSQGSVGYDMKVCGPSKDMSP